MNIKLLPNSALAGSTVAERLVTLQGERGWCRVHTISTNSCRAAS